MTTAASPRLHLYVLLDRSGSMEPMRHDVVAGYNELVGEHRAAASNAGPEPRITLVEFDDVDPSEVIVDAARVNKAPMLSTDDFAPRGMTPLLDATVRLLDRAELRVATRVEAKRRPESIVVVTITDGEENASQHTTRKALLARVRKLEKQGWTFAFLGAGLDAYAEAGVLGYDARSVQAWACDGTGARGGFQSVSRASMTRRQKLHASAAYDAGDFFEGVKEAEDDRDQRSK